MGNNRHAQVSGIQQLGEAEWESSGARTEQDGCWGNLGGESPHWLPPWRIFEMGQSQAVSNVALPQPAPEAFPSHRPGNMSERKGMR